MRKTVLVGLNARYIHVNSAIRSLQLSAQRYAEELGVPAGTIVRQDYTIQQGTEAIYYSILREQPDIVAFSVYIWNVSMVRDLCRDLRLARPDCILILGGPEVSYGTEHTGISEYDYVIEGEGERAFYALLARLQQPDFEPPARWRFEVTGKRVRCAPMPSLDELPFIYEEDEPGLKHRILYYEASRGCPFRCGYCLSAPEKGVRQRSLPLILAELQQLTDRGIPLVKFVDRTFNCDPRRSQAILEWIGTLPAAVPTCFHLEVEADHLTPELIRTMTRLPRGRIQVEIGVQSTNPETLAACHRNPSVERCLENTRQLIEAGNMKVHTDLIAGLPYEGLERFRQSFTEVYALGAHQLQLGFLKRLQGAPLAAEPAEYGYRFSPHPPYELLGSRWIGPEELWELKQVEAVLERYGNSGHFRHFLAEMEKEYADSYSMWKDLAAFYDSEGLIFASLGALETYNLAVRFAQTKGRAQQLKEALLLDYYGFTASEHLPLGLEEIGRRPENCRTLAAELLRRCNDRSRRYMIRFINSRPIQYDYTEPDPVTGEYTKRFVEFG